MTGSTFCPLSPANSRQNHGGDAIQDDRIRRLEMHPRVAQLAVLVVMDSMLSFAIIVQWSTYNEPFEQPRTIDITTLMNRNSSRPICTV